jgi:hypothetical protein
MLMLTLGVHADLILHIDTVNDEVFFTGTDLIVPTGLYGGAYYNWQSSGYLPENKIQELYVLGLEPSIGVNFTVLELASDGEMNLLFHHTVNPPVSVSYFSLEGTGQRSAYDIGFPEIVDFLDNYSKGDLRPVQQNGGLPRTISVQVIPEPVTALLFGFGGMGAWLLRRNHRRIR